MHMAYYVTAHGYGHGVRSCDILTALLARHPHIRVTVTTDLPEAFLRSRLQGADGRLRVRPGAFDVGMVQKDSIRVDVDATLDEALERVGALVGARLDWTRLEAFLPDGLSGALGRSALASSFVAILELARQGRVDIKQEEIFAPIFLRPAAAEPEMEQREEADA